MGVAALMNANQDEPVYGYPDNRDEFDVLYSGHIAGQADKFCDK